VGVGSLTALFIGVPLLAQILLRKLPLPTHSPLSNRLAEAAHPRRCWVLWGALVDQIRYVSLIPMYFRVHRLHRAHPDELKGISYGSPSGHRLDLFLPKSASLSGGSAPVAIFVHGGAWEHGERVQYVEVGQTLAQHGYIAVVVDYTKVNDGPRVGKEIGNVGDATTDVVRCLLWVCHTVRSEFGLTGNNKIVLIGHSSGSHLVSNAIVGLMLRATVALRPGSVASTAFHPDIEHALSPDVANTLLQRVFSVIGLSGVYDIRDHIEVEKHRGVEWVSAMHRVMESRHHYARHSPAETIRQLQPTDRGRDWPNFVLFHGEDDVTVPSSASTKFAAALQTVGLDVHLERLNGACHTSVLFDLIGAAADASTAPARRVSQVLTAAAGSADSAE
jgi:acetyl esterase/lipase